MQVQISRVKDRVLLRTPWQPGIAEACKSVAGANWSKTQNAWTYPLTMHTLRTLREVFGDALSPDKALLAYGREQAAKERFLSRMASRTDAKLGAAERIAPEMAKAMADRTYQRVGAVWGARAGSFLLADEPGLGKTITVLAALMEGGNWSGSNLVVASKTALFSVWARQIKMWTGATAYAMPDGAVRRRKVWEEFSKDTSSPKFLIINPAMLRREYKNYCKKCGDWDPGRNKSWPKPEHHRFDHTHKRTIYKDEFPEIVNAIWDTVIIDESHRLFAAYTPSNVSQMTQGALDIKSKRRIGMTGTPLRGEERKIWGTLDWIGVKTGGYWAFVNGFFEVAQNIFGGKQIRGLDPSRSDAFYRLLDAHILRRTRLEVRGDLPASRRQDVLVEMSPRHKAQYDEFVKMGEVALDEGSVGGMGMLSELTRIKQMAYGMWTRPGGPGSKMTPTTDSPKLDWLINEFLANRGVTGGRDEWFPEEGVAYKYVVASQFVEVVDSIERELNRIGIKTLKVTGAVTGAKRTTAQEIFQSTDREYRVMLLNTMAGGESIELDAWCDEGVIIDETFIADDQVQVEGRYENRSGRISPRMTWYVRTANTIDQTIGDENFRQESIQHQLLDGRRGVTLARHILRGEVIEWKQSSSVQSAVSSAEARSTPLAESMAPRRRTPRSAVGSSVVLKSGKDSPPRSKPRHRRRQVQS